MRKKEKTRGQIIDELSELRQRIAGLEISETERKQAEKALQEERNRLQAVVGAIEYGLTVQDRDYNIIYQNGLLRNTFGGLGEKCFKVYENKNKICNGCPVKIAYKDGKSHTSVRRVVMPSGEIAFWENTANPIRNAKGEIISCLEIARNITERKKAEESLREKTAYLDQLFESAQEGIVVTDKNGKVTRVNKEFLALFGYTHDEVIGETLDELISSKDLYAKARSITLDIAKGREITFETVRQRKDKKLIDVSVLASPIIIDGELVAVYGIYRDITERKQEEAVRDVLLNISRATPKTTGLDDLLATIHEQIGTLMDAKNFFICLAHDTKKNLYTFPYYKDINPEDIVEPEEIFEITEGLTHHVLKTKKYLLGTKEELKKIGVIGTVPESWLGVPLKTESGDVNGVVAVQSYEKEAYSEKDAQVLSIIASNIAGLLTYKKAEDQIKKSLKEKEVLLQEIHHRVKNNLQVISSMLRLQSDKTEDKKVQEVFKGSQNRIKSMALIHDMLYQSKDFTRVSFANYVKHLSNYLFSTYKINTNVVRLKTDVKEAFLDINRAIPCGLIINELVSNSLKYAFVDGREGEICIKFHSDKKGKFMLVVSDDGVGLPGELDIHKTETLGMRLVTILAEQIRGSVDLDREGGTSFKIAF